MKKVLFIAVILFFIVPSFSYAQTPTPTPTLTPTPTNTPTITPTPTVTPTSTQTPLQHYEEIPSMIPRNAADEIYDSNGILINYPRQKICAGTKYNCDDVSVYFPLPVWVVTPKPTPTPTS